METTTIEISTENWSWLNKRKEPGESFNDVLDRLRTGEGGVRAPESFPDELDLPGSGDVLDRRQATLLELYEYLQEEGTATKSDFLELIDPEEVSYSSPESFWANAVKGRDTLRALPGVISPGEGEHRWKFDG